ncbi:ThiF family protein [Eremomyces bilateralis CBS 781.70]|uniref:Ubiquitin-activating enzyme E1-like n=1 Tax=Eremomyces bilateralis CBS 781.70 TaxID=1392243 RepID=A0A6G1G8V0_9PEZI|nr:ThiF family protein [Eremomyces bilateralis CBS 781.70]KAF1814351.1 ThiF family protein [Eremomyces bilateralis CBS 781.70]
MSRDKHARQALGNGLHDLVEQTRVLMVGAGGIGCELLKNLTLTGFGEIEIVDLDTIDLSNLNRQFLFRHEHIKKPKALVAKEAAAKFNPKIKLVAHHGNIKDSTFNVEWFKRFTLVFNALDNVDARRHVNKMCLAADIPLVDGGTAGFNGNVRVIKKGVSECYDCQEREAPKGYAVCTIRSTPSQPIHCIVWAKSYLLTEVFGKSEEDAPELDHSEDAENANEIATLQKEAQALKGIRKSMGTPEFGRLVFDKVFGEDIERLLSMDDLWKTRKRPRSLKFEVTSKDAKGLGPSTCKDAQKTWSLAENFVVFLDSLDRLSKRSMALKSEGTAPIIDFDKDDEDTLDFVSASANIRSEIFGIETKSKFDIKQMAGNIIPAIATTNAMIAGLCVLQAFKVLKSEYTKARVIFLSHNAERATNTEPLRPPNPNCRTCGSAQTQVIIDPGRATLQHLIEDVLRLELGYGEELSVSSVEGTLYDPDFEENLGKKFSELGITSNSQITVYDEDDDPRVDLVLHVTEKSLSDASKPVLLPDKFELARKPKSAAAVDQQVSESLLNGTLDGQATGTKRKRGPGDDDLPTSKKEKASDTNGVNPLVIVVEDDTSGALVIDD